MKRLLHYVLLLMVLFNYAPTFGATQVIDLRTGIINGSNVHIPWGSPDDTWSICLPGSNPFNPGSYQLPVCGANVLHTGLDPLVQWIAPDPIPFIGPDNVPHGDYYYKVTFTSYYCSIQSAIINLAHIGGDNSIDEIIVNGTSHAVSYTFNPFTNNTSITLANSEIIQGQNEILVHVYNSEQYSGMEINGDLTINAGSFLNFGLKDATGNPKSEYCLEENVFMDAPAIASGLYDIDLAKNGSAIASTGWLTGSPNGIDLTTLFESSPTNIFFQPGVTYTITLNLISPCVLSMTKTFTYKCCANSLNASFWVNTTDGPIEVLERGKGTHVWSIYSIPPVSNGKYTWLKNFYTPTFSYDEVNLGGCYYVTHTITNGCGTACAAQIVCKSDCVEKRCNLSKPTGLISGQTNNLLKWDAVPQATYYTVEINPYDPRCCRDDNPGGVSINYPSKYFNVHSGQTFTWNYADLGLESFPRTPVCFSWRVIAYCPDGGKVYSDYSCSWNDGSIDPPDDPNGLTGDKPADNGTGNQKGNGDVQLQNATKELKGTTVNVFPNPSKSSVSVDLTTADDVEFSINIYDISGKLVRFYEHLKTINKKSTVKLQESLSKGTYIIKIVTSDNQVIDRKLIIE